MNDQLAVGDTVILKSGSPVITITSYDKRTEQFTCQWFDGGKVEMGWFPANALVKSELSANNIARPAEKYIGPRIKVKN